MTVTMIRESPVELSTAEPLIELVGVAKVYRTGKLEYPALRGVDLSIDAGEMVAVVGPSGSGKTTIMNMITGIDRPTDGLGDGRRPADRCAQRRAARGLARPERRHRLPVLPAAADAHGARERHAAARLRAPGPKRDRRADRRHNLELVGLGDKLDHLPSELSGGEQQRVAIARALASDPKLIIGDEPTGNLDTQTAAEMFELLQRLNDEGKTVLYVTHDLELAARAGRVVTIRDGLVVGRVRRRTWPPRCSRSRSRI